MIAEACGLIRSIIRLTKADQTLLGAAKRSWVNELSQRAVRRQEMRPPLQGLPRGELPHRDRSSFNETLIADAQGTRSGSEFRFPRGRLPPRRLIECLRPGSVRYLLSNPEMWERCGERRHRHEHRHPPCDAGPVE